MGTTLFKKKKKKTFESRGIVFCLNRDLKKRTEDELNVTTKLNRDKVEETE